MQQPAGAYGKQTWNSKRVELGSLVAWCNRVCHRQ